MMSRLIESLPLSSPVRAAGRRWISGAMLALVRCVALLALFVLIDYLMMPPGWLQ